MHIDQIVVNHLRERWKIKRKRMNLICTFFDRYSMIEETKMLRERVEFDTISINNMYADVLNI